MGDIREFWLATAFVALGMAICVLLCIYTPAQNWLGIVKFAFVLVGGLTLGLAMILGFAGVSRLLSKGVKGD